MIFREKRLYCRYEIRIRSWKKDFKNKKEYLEIKNIRVEKIIGKYS